METYVFLDENNIIINTVVFNPLDASDELINTVMSASGGFKAILLGAPNPQNSVQNVQNPFGPPSIGYEFDGIDTFRPQKPGDNYILDIYNLNWVEIPNE